MDADNVVNADEQGPTLYNATIRAASRLFRLPSRLLARVRRLEEVLNEDGGRQSSAYASHGRPGRYGPSQGGAEVPIGLGTPVPGPLGFLTSGYFFGLFVMALILNRIQNIVVPARSPLAVRLHTARARGGRWPFLRIISSYFFPVDLSSTSFRTLFRIPSIYLLAKSLLIWSALLLQTAQHVPPWKLSFLEAINQWISQKQMEDICWFTFTSACVALGVGALTNGLEGLRLNSNAPFNLFSFSFQLYIYASPSTHAEQVPGGLSRPSKHVMITILIQLLQLTLLHCLEVKQRWSRNRLLPTTFCALLNLAHFHSIIWTSPPSYPLTNFFPCVVESMLGLIILLSLGLNALTQLLLEGTISRPLFGHAETLMPKLDEDFSVMLVRLGTASLEVTSAAGLGNEVGSVINGTSAIMQPAREDDHAIVEIDRAGVVSITPALNRHGGHMRHKRGLANEISHVKPHAQRSDSWADSLLNIRWLKAFSIFLVTAAKVGSRLGQKIWSMLRRRPQVEGVVDQQPGQHPVSPIRSGVDPDMDENEEADLNIYRRFLRGEQLSDEEDEDYEPSNSDALLDGVQDGMAAESDEEYNESERETVELYADLSQESSAPETAPLLLAHMTSPTLLTRRRYRTLVPDSRRDVLEGNDNWNEFVQERRQTKASRVDDASLETVRKCVICTVEPRNIICWPCRCLAMCNDCRENLASRSSASKHTCPCCRHSVEGYSKIYIP